MSLLLKPGGSIVLGFFGPPDGPGEALMITLDMPAARK